MAQEALPEVAAVPGAEELAHMDDGAVHALVTSLRDAERATMTAMAPFNRHLAEIRARLGELSTEQRRRERAAHVARRAGVREAAKSGELPSLAAALDAPAGVEAGTPLADLRFFLRSGGEIGLGFATRPGAVTFTDGRRQAQARTWEEALRLHEAGWELGTPGIAGVRVHLAGSRVERVVQADDVVLDLQRDARAGGTSSDSG